MSLPAADRPIARPLRHQKHPFSPCFSPLRFYSRSRKAADGRQESPMWHWWRWRTVISMSKMSGPLSQLSVHNHSTHSGRKQPSFCRFILSINGSESLRIHVWPLRGRCRSSSVCTGPLLDSTDISEARQKWKVIFYQRTDMQQESSIKRED